MAEALRQGLELGNPQGLWLALLLVPLLAIHLLRGRPPPVVVSSLLLWRVRPGERHAALPRRLHLPERSFWLNALALLAIALAAAEPRVASVELSPRLALILDVSASMQTLEGPDTPRLDLAKAAARGWLQRAHPDAEVLLLAAGRTPRVLSPFGSSRSELQAQLAALRAEDDEGEINAAVELAREQLARSVGRTELVLFTDGALADPMASVPDSAFEHTVRVGRPQVNIAIVQLEVSAESRTQSPTPKATAPQGQASRAQASPEPSAQSTFGVLVLATVKNFGLQSRTVQVRLHQRNARAELASSEAVLEPGGEQLVALRFEATPADQGTGIWVELSPGDALAVDDRVFAVIPLHARQPVVLVAERPNPWLTRALRADRGVELSSVSPQDLDTAQLPTAALLVYSGYCPSETPPGSFVVFDPKEGNCFDVNVGATQSDLAFTHWDEQDLRFRFAQLDDVQLTRAHALRPQNATDALAWSHGSALIARAHARDRQGTIVGFDLADSNWPFNASFVLFVRNLVELAKGPLGAASHTTQTGQTLSVAVPADVTTVAMAAPAPEPAPPAGDQSPSAARQVLPAHDGRTLLPPLTRVGFYHFSWQGSRPGSSLAAASLLSPRESDPAQRDVPTLASDNVAVQVAPPTRLPLAPWLVVLALLAICLETRAATRAALPSPKAPTRRGALP
jgi:von Willebrand factor type A domain